jgi:hypothetical protein
MTKEKTHRRNWILLEESNKGRIHDAHAGALYEIIIFDLKDQFPCKIDSIDFVQISEASGYVNVIISE